jgi:ketosteroid isomerase-like protein
MMAENVVFLLPGREPMRGRAGFAAAAQASGRKFRLVESTPQIQEIVVSGDYAFCWNHLDLKMQSPEDGQMQRRAGDVLSVFRKEPGGRWVIFRDANLLTPQKG